MWFTAISMATRSQFMPDIAKARMSAYKIFLIMDEEDQDQI